MALDPYRREIPPATGVTPDWRGMITNFSASIGAIIPVASATDQAQLIADIQAAGGTIDATHPVVTFRADQPGSVIEYTIDGQTWLPVRPLALVRQTAQSEGEVKVSSTTPVDIPWMTCTFPAIQGWTYDIDASIDTYSTVVNDVISVHILIDDEVLTFISGAANSSQQVVQTSNTHPIATSWKATKSGTVTLKMQGLRAAGSGICSFLTATGNYSVVRVTAQGIVQ